MIAKSDRGQNFPIGGAESSHTSLELLQRPTTPLWRTTSRATHVTSEQEFQSTVKFLDLPRFSLRQRTRRVLYFLNPRTQPFNEHFRLLYSRSGGGCVFIYPRRVVETLKMNVTSSFYGTNCDNGSGWLRFRSRGEEFCLLNKFY